MLPAVPSSINDSRAVLLHVVAVIAQDCWCQEQATKMLAKDDRRHSAHPQNRALVPFVQLGPVERRHLLMLVGDHLKRLVAEIDYPLGDDREFVVSEMRVGLPVGWSRHVQSEDPDEDLSSLSGRVTGWEAMPWPDEELLRVIRVEWSNGESTEHIPCERDLRRVS